MPEKRQGRGAAIWLPQAILNFSFPDPLIDLELKDVFQIHRMKMQE
jgi:hypothetical protein